MSNCGPRPFPAATTAAHELATDVFVWARGEPPNPAMTKIGGVPYRPRSSPWPRDREGKPVRLIARALLCGFPRYPRRPARRRPSDLRGRRHPARRAGTTGVRMAQPWDWRTRLRGPADGGQRAPDGYYGVIHRTEDWPDVLEEIPGRYRCPWLLSVFEGTKIGGLPRFIQDEPTPAGRFLCALGSISANYSAYPLINGLEPTGWSDRDLIIGDMGSLYLFLDPQGRVHAESQCY